jgi:hypothetical protein
MLALICRLSLADGRSVTGRVEARSPGQPYRISYSGATDCLGMKPETGTASDLELVFRMAANTHNGIVSVERTGDYESKSATISSDN